jgi:hypothetical protein
VRNSKGSRSVGSLGLSEMIILKHIVKKYDGRAWAGLICVRVGKYVGLL